MVSKEKDFESQESFLEKIGGKISVVARDGSQIAYGNQDNSMHFVRPLKQRHLPMVALKFKAKTPMLCLQKQKGSNTFTTRIPIIPAAAATSTETTPIHILIKKKISENLKPKKIVEDVIVPNQNRDITKIPTVKRTISHNGDEEGSIFNLEQRDDGRRSRLKNINQLEALVSKKISEWPSWGTNLMRDLTRIIEPLYAADMLRDSINNIDRIDEKKNESFHDKDNQEYPLNTEKQAREFDFSTKSYDDNVTVPSAGLFFAVIDTNRSQKKTRESISGKGQYSRAGSSYSEMHRAKSSGSSILSPKSQSALSYHQTKEQDDMTTTSYYPTEIVEYEDIPNFENFDENLDIHHHEIELSKLQTEKPTHAKKDEGFNYDEKSYLLQHESDMSRSVTSSSSIHSGSKSQNQKKFKASYFPPTDVKLGGLGPDKDSESYLSKLEKVRKQKEYADNIRKHVLSQKQKSKKIDQVPQVLAPIIYEKQSSTITKLPKINLKSMMGESLSDAALTKHQKMKLYANQVKRPMISSSKSLQELKCLPSINRYRHISAPNMLTSSPNLNLMKLEEKHLQDLKAVEEIRRYYQ